MTPRRGRPPKPQGEARTERVEVRLTPAEHAQLAALGGAGWIRAQLESARRTGGPKP